jgi:pentatricopeptide repeat protein
MMGRQSILLLAAGLALGAAAPDPPDFDANIAAFAALRSSHEEDLAAHEQYQDAVRRYGIEGHLRAMTEEYQALAASHPGDLKYRYLAARALIGRSTRSAIQTLSAIEQENPDFAPVRRTLAEAARMQPPLPPPSPLLDRAEQLFQKGGDPEQIGRMADAAIRADEWRSQRIRAFDWYSPELKRQTIRDMQSEYWRLWDLLVRCYGKNAQPEKAAQLLETMQQRASHLNDPQRLKQVQDLRAALSPRN